MPLKLVTGPANAGKAQLLLDAARADAERGREPLLVVPTRADESHYRRELAAEASAVFGVRVQRFAGLVEEIAHRAGMRANPLSALARERVVAALAARAPLRSFGAAASTPGFARALSALVAELGAARVAPARLRGALARWAPDGSPRSAYAHDVANLYDAYRRALDRLDRPDAELWATRALDALRRAPARWHGTPVLFYGFDDLTGLQLDAIETLARIVDAPVTVSLAYEAGRLAFAGRAGSFQTLAPLAADHVVLQARAEHYAPPARAALHHLERTLFEPDVARADVDDARPAVRLLEGGGERAELELVCAEIRALLEQGVPPEEVAVVVRPSPSGAALLAEVLAAAGIPHAFERRRRFGDTALGRGLLGLMRAALLDGTGADLLAWLRAPGVLSNPELADALEERSRTRGATSVAEVRALWEERHWTLDALDRLREASARGPGELLSRVTDELQRLFSAPWPRSAPRLAAAELDDARTLGAGLRLLGELERIAADAPELACDAEGLVGALESLEVVHGQPPHAGAVAVLDPLALRARRVRALFLVGLQEGVFPSPATAEPFLADEERRRLAEASGLVLPRHDDGLGAERYLLYATVSRPQELLVLSWHTADDEGVPVVPSPFLDDICDLFVPRLREQRRRRELGAVRWPGPGDPPPGIAAREAALEAPRVDPALLAPLADEQVLARLREAPWSASGLETWVGCPVRWFVERLLRPGDLEPDPEPLVRGGLAHAVLEATLQALAAETGSARLTAERLPLARRLMHQALAERIDTFPLSARPERRPVARRRLEIDLERFLEHAARSESALEPRYLELAFGFEDEGEPAFELDEGVRVRGRIDRVDVDDCGRAIVYDYKGRNAPEPAKWVSDGRFQVAVYMRAVEQLLDLRVVGGFYQPLGIRDLRARGLLDGDAGVELQCVNGDRREHAEYEALVSDALSLARSAAAEARAGRLEPRPATCDYGGGCRYPTICRCET